MRSSIQSRVPGRAQGETDGAPARFRRGAPGMRGTADQEASNTSSTYSPVSPFSNERERMR